MLIVLIAILLFFENRFIFFPARYPEGNWQLPHATVEVCFFKTADGLNIHAWWLPGQTDSCPVMLWFCGNAGNITNRGENLRMLAGRDMGVLLVEYRGYGKSEGSPTERGIYLDGEAAYDYLALERGIAPWRIVCFGRSLGSTVALHVALKRSAAGLVLETPFASARAMARRMIPVLPVWLFIRAKLDNVGRVPALKVPLLVIHGTRDEVVPFEQGVAVYEAAPLPKEFYRIEGAQHNDTYLVGGEAYFQRLVVFCRRCVERTGEAGGSLRPQGGGATIGP
jgi:hypothetical protein